LKLNGLKKKRRTISQKPRGIKPENQKKFLPKLQGREEIEIPESSKEFRKNSERRPLKKKISDE